MKNQTKTTFILTLILVITSVAYLDGAHAQSPVIVVSLTPEIINADGETHEIITIELQTASGNPLLAPRDTPIQLTLSNLDIGEVSHFVTIPEGKTYTKAVFKAKKNSGLGIITASSPGFVTGDAYISVLRSNFDASLRVYASPNSQPVQPGEKGTVVVQLMDSSGEPFVAIDDVPITLTSSNNSICTVEKDLIIQKGSNYATTMFTVTGSTPGEVLISAQTQGFAPGNDIVNTFNITGTPQQVSLFFGPDTVLPDEETHEIVTVQLQNQYGEPAAAKHPTIIYLSSSNTNIAAVEETVTIKTGEYKTTATLTTYAVNGETTISASSTGLYPDYESIIIQGQVPTVLDLYVNPETIIANETNYEIITLQLLDDEGNPVEARQDTVVYLTSSNTNTGTVPDSTIIAQGKSYTTVPFTSTGQAGTTTIAASTMGIEPAEKELESITMQFNMTLITPNTIRINQTFTVQVRITSGGLPVQNTLVDWTALGGVIISEENLTDTNGIAEANIIQRYDQLRLKAVASKSGYERKEAQKNIQITQDVESKELTIKLLGREFKVFQVLIVLALIIAIALAGYVYIKYRKSREDEPEDLEIYT